MTPEEFKDEMARIANHTSEGVLFSEDYDKEMRHLKMDALMVEVLRGLGYGEGVEIFVQTDKWYA